MSFLLPTNSISICHMNRPWIAAIIVATIFILFRIITATHSELANFTPIAALLFCGAAFMKSNKWMLPTIIFVWLISNPMVSMLQGYPVFNATLVTALGFTAVIFIGLSFAGKPLGKLIFGTILGATAFYLITNTISFFQDPTYAKTLEGYIQCMWTGNPASPLHSTPTWTFFRNSLVANTLGTCLFLVAMHIPAIKKATQFQLTKQAA